MALQTFKFDNGFTSTKGLEFSFSRGATTADAFGNIIAHDVPRYGITLSNAFYDVLDEEVVDADATDTIASGYTADGSKPILVRDRSSSGVFTTFTIGDPLSPDQTTTYEFFSYGSAFDIRGNVGDGEAHRPGALMVCEGAIFILCEIKVDIGGGNYDAGGVSLWMISNAENATGTFLTDAIEVFHQNDTVCTVVNSSNTFGESSGRTVGWTQLADDQPRINDNSLANYYAPYYSGSGDLLEAWVSFADYVASGGGEGGIAGILRIHRDSVSSPWQVDSEGTVVYQKIADTQSSGVHFHNCCVLRYEEDGKPDRVRAVVSIGDNAENNTVNVIELVNDSYATPGTTGITPHIRLRENVYGFFDDDEVLNVTGHQYWGSCPITNTNKLVCGSDIDTHIVTVMDFPESENAVPTFSQRFTNSGMQIDSNPNRPATENLHIHRSRSHITNTPIVGKFSFSNMIRFDSGTGLTMTIGSTSGVFDYDEVIEEFNGLNTTGVTAKFRAYSNDDEDGNQILLYKQNGTFTNSRTITGASSGATATITSTSGSALDAFASSRFPVIFMYSTDEGKSWIPIRPDDYNKGQRSQDAPWNTVELDGYIYYSAFPDGMFRFPKPQKIVSQRPLTVGPGGNNGIYDGNVWTTISDLFGGTGVFNLTPTYNGEIATDTGKKLSVIYRETSGENEGKFINPSTSLPFNPQPPTLANHMFVYEVTSFVPDFFAGGNPTSNFPLPGTNAYMPGGKFTSFSGWNNTAGSGYHRNYFMVDSENLSEGITFACGLQISPTQAGGGWDGDGNRITVFSKNKWHPSITFEKASTSKPSFRYTRINYNIVSSSTDFCAPVRFYMAPGDLCYNTSGVSPLPGYPKELTSTYKLFTTDAGSALVFPDELALISGAECGDNNTIILSGTFDETSWDAGMVIEDDRDYTMATLYSTTDTDTYVLFKLLPDESEAHVEFYAGGSLVGKSIIEDVMCLRGRNITFTARFFDGSNNAHISVFNCGGELVGNTVGFSAGQVTTFQNAQFDQIRFSDPDQTTVIPFNWYGGSVEDAFLSDAQLTNSLERQTFLTGLSGSRIARSASRRMGASQLSHLGQAFGELP